MRALPRNKRPRFAPAFTLPEILGVMAIFALTAAIVAANYDALPAAFRHPSPESAVRRAFGSARRLALETHAPVTVRVLEKSLRLTDARGEPGGDFEVLGKEDPRRVDLIADDDTKPADADPLYEIRFGASGSVTPARVRLLDKNTSSLRLWRADPLSAILTEEKDER